MPDNFRNNGNGGYQNPFAPNGGTDNSQFRPKNNVDDNMNTIQFRPANGADAPQTQAMYGSAMNDAQNKTQAMYGAASNMQPPPRNPMPYGGTPNGQIPQNPMPYGGAPNGQPPRNPMPYGGAPNGQIPQNRMSYGGAPNGQPPRNPMPYGGAPNGQPPYKNNGGNKKKKGSKAVLIIIVTLVLAIVVLAGAAAYFLLSSDDDDDDDDRRTTTTASASKDDEEEESTEKTSEEEETSEEETTEEKEVFVKTPNVVGKNYTSAVKELEDLDFAVQIESEFSDKVKDKDVISQNIAPGTKVEKGSSITIYVSKGPDKPKEVTVPDVRGEMQNIAEEMLTDCGFKVKVEGKFDSTVPKGVVISQSVPPKRTAEEGSVITITVSKGREEKPDEGEKTMKGRVATKETALNVRKEPDKSGELIGTVAKDSTVEIISRVGDWYKIKFKDGIGYVSVSYIELLD